MDYSGTYKKFFKKLKNYKKQKHDVFSMAVGGDYEEMGYIQMQLLKHAGLNDHQHVVDVGCGTGRLACQLSETKHYTYTGFDVVDEFLKYARKKCPQSGFRFKKISGTNIPLSEESVNYVCFFSVFTHLLHEDSFKYLLSAREVLKVGGKVVFSFLTFDEDEHWELFDQMVYNKEATHHNQFVTNHQLEIWAEKLGFQIDLLEKGSTPFIPLEKPIKLQSGANFDKLGSLGQGVCIYPKI